MIDDLAKVSPNIEQLGLGAAGAAMLALGVRWMFGLATRDAAERAELRTTVKAQGDRLEVAERKGAECEVHREHQARDIKRLDDELREIKARNDARDAERRIGT